MAFKDRLKEARLKINLSKEDFAKKIGVSASAIGNYEAGASFPKTEILYKMFDVLDTTPNFLFQDVSSKTKEELTIYEFELIKKYRALDVYGKEVIDDILDIEYRRCEESDEYTTTVAARGNSELKRKLSKSALEEDLQKPMSTGFDD